MLRIILLVFLALFTLLDASTAQEKGSTVTADNCIPQPTCRVAFRGLEPAPFPPRNITTQSVRPGGDFRNEGSIPAERIR